MKDGFDERVASEGGLYGPGCYFAEKACKSHAYTKPPDENGTLIKFLDLLIHPCKSLLLIVEAVEVGSGSRVAQLIKVLHIQRR